MIFIGMDVHVRNSYLCVKDESGQRLKRGRVDNTLGALAEFLGPYESQAMWVSMESTTNSRALVQLVERYGRKAGVDLTARVLDARRLRIIAESVNKCDRIDAEVIADLTRSTLSLPTCYVPDDETFALREHLRARGDLVRVRTMVKNRIHAVLHRRGVLRAQGDLFAKAGRTWLEQLDLDEAGRTTIDRYLSLKDELDEHLQASSDEVKKVMRQPRWSKSAALLMTMPGVGIITAMTVLAELGELSRFRGRASVAHYAGLTPKVRDSNQTIRRGGIGRRGNQHLRAVLVEAAWTAIRSAPAYAALYERVRERRGCQVAIVAVARRMLEDMYSMMRKDEAFRYVDPSPSADRATRDPQVAPSEQAVSLEA